MPRSALVGTPAIHHVLDEFPADGRFAPDFGEARGHAAGTRVFIQPVETDTNRHGNRVADHDRFAIAEKRQKIHEAGGAVGDSALNDLLIAQTGIAEDEGRVALG